MNRHHELTGGHPCQIREENLSDTERKLLDQIKTDQEEMMKGILDIVSIPSERQEPESGAPYGRPVRKALEQTVQMARDMGFETAILEDTLGLVQYGGPIDYDQDYIGVFGHLDVVPAKDQEGWSHDPYDPDIRDGQIYARGILDNKGPVLSCLYALKAIKEQGIVPKHPIRIVFGTNEETGMEDMPLYLEHVKAPMAGFTPDCKFPVVYAERGRHPIRIVFGTNEETGMEDMPLYLEHVKAPMAGFTPDCKFPVVYAERGRAVYEIQFETAEATIDWVNRYFLSGQTKEQALGLAISDPEFGQLDLRNTHMDTQKVSFSISYPPCVSIEQITDILREKAHGGTVECMTDWEPVYFPKDSTLCTVLQSAYEDLTSLDGTPVPTTGGTYAKRMPGIVPFGPSFPGQKGIAHLPDEWMNVEDLKKLAEIYGLSLYRLSQKEEF